MASNEQQVPLKMPFREIHLDFHTSEKIEGIGAGFEPEEFAAVLEQARVNSITCFARCHHGWLYYDSKRFPERIHPHLERRDLLRDQIEVCHRKGIRVPVYITVQWDHFTAEHHPEWLTVSENGGPIGRNDLFEAGFYRFLCVNSPYIGLLKSLTREVLETIPVDGLFFDIVQPQPCACRYCREGMEQSGLDPSDANSRMKYGLKVINSTSWMIRRGLYRLMVIIFRLILSW